MNRTTTNRRETLLVPLAQGGIQRPKRRQLYESGLETPPSYKPFVRSRELEFPPTEPQITFGLAFFRLR